MINRDTQKVVEVRSSIKEEVDDSDRFSEIQEKCFDFFRQNRSKKRVYTTQKVIFTGNRPFKNPRSATGI